MTKQPITTWEDAAIAHPPAPPTAWMIASIAVIACVPIIVIGFFALTAVKP
jgi:hypothetical protein